MPSAMFVDDRFIGVAAKFFALFGPPRKGGGAVAVYLHGEPVVDIWAGFAAPGRRWQRDTMAMAYSTGKGVAATVLHRLADRGLIDYDAAVADYWPEFAANGKAGITVRDVLRHRAGLQQIRGLLPDKADLLDHDAVAAALAVSAPDPLRYKASGYHAITFGTLVAEICQRVTGRDFRDLVRQELAVPLGESDFWFGVPVHERGRLAKLGPRMSVAKLPVDGLLGIAAAVPPLRSLRGVLYDGMLNSAQVSDTVYDAMMPGWNGVFTARSLARMYGAIANDGLVGNQRLLRSDTAARIAEMPFNSKYDYVLGGPPNHSLGYHRAIVGTHIRRDALGHFGIGGSGAMAMPRLGLSIAFVTNHLGNMVSTLGDARLPVLAAIAARAARELPETESVRSAAAS
ncbi:serine hydrolase domain-containing protein [Nocardia sp. NPDC020380]|uniref:serine hydrolase domain-containing protein n=1 Tax=Nocardia sp. NPDC020380 TaxID=3364309 RepID=UPI0037B6FA75